MLQHLNFEAEVTEETKQEITNILLKERKRPYAPFIPLEKDRIKVKGVEYPLRFEIVGTDPLSFELVFYVFDNEEWVDLYRIWFMDKELEAASYLPTNLSRMWEAYKAKNKLPFAYSEFYPLDKDCWVAVNALGSFLVDGNANIVQQIEKVEQKVCH